jgi:sulfate transport system permease protein
MSAVAEVSSPAGFGTGWRFREKSAIPGFVPAFAWTLIWLSFIVLIPLGALILRASGIGISGFVDIIGDPRVLSALRITFGLSFLAAMVNAVFGLIIAWALVRYRFPGSKLADAAVDLPFALPTAVAGIALASLYAPNGWLGVWFAEAGIKVAYTPFGIFIALVFIGLPFVVRTVQPLIAEIDKEIEEASATLGASRARTLRCVILPPLAPALLTGFALAFARAVGEYGSVIFIAGNLPYVSEIVPILIVIKLEEFNYAGATAIATVMLAISFVMLLAINLIQAWSRRRFGYA